MSRILAVVVMQKVFAFLGEHLTADLPDRVATSYAEGFELLALDSAAIEVCTAGRLPYSTIDDWISTADRAVLRGRVVEAAGDWFSEARSAMTVEGTCWPEFDRYFQIPFWQEWLLQAELTREFVERGVGVLRYHAPSGERPSISTGEADTWGTNWSTLDQFELQPIAIGHARPAVLRRPWEKVLRLFRSAKLGSVASRPVQTGIGVAFNIGECHRFTPAVESLRAAGWPIAGHVLSPDLGTAFRWRDRWGVPVSPAPRIVKRLGAESFERGIQAVAASGSPWAGAVRAAPWHFRFLAQTRWPRLAGLERYWTERWQRLAPRAVLVSSLETAESQLPARAASALGIRTFAAPHGAIHLKRFSDSSAETLLCDTPLQAYLYRAVGTGAKVMRASPLIAADEYEAEPLPRGSQRGRVVVLVEPVSAARGRGLTDPWVGHREQLAALAAIPTLAALAGERGFDLVVRPHPGFPDAELLKSAGVAGWMEPPGGPLSEALSGARLIVVLNYLGSALLHASRAGAPIVVYRTAKALRLHAVAPCMASLRIAETEPELRDIVEAGLVDGPARETLMTGTTEFRRRWVDDGTVLPTLGDLIGRAQESKSRDG